jgi:hypothetical protein
MTGDIESIAAKLADDSTITDDELIRLINDLGAATGHTHVVDFEKYRIRKVLETCARYRDLEWSGSLSLITRRCSP